MDLGKPIKVGPTSGLIDLKSELLRKKAELEAKKSHGPGGRGVPKSQSKNAQIKPSKLSYKNSGVEARNRMDLQARDRDIVTHDKARQILEAKAKIYEQMSSDALKYDESEHPVLINSLVDFTKKVVDNQERLKTANIVSFEKEGEEWTEFTDSFGRTRQCRKNDLADFLEKDKETVESFKKTDGSSSLPTQIPKSLPGFATEEEVREAKRKKWDQEAMEAMNKDHVHYQDVLFDEVRSHGVGYFGFSKNSLERDEQIRELKKLSKETDKKRKEALKDRAEKKSKLKERLKKVRDRKRAKLGLPPLEDQSSEDSQSSEGEIGPQPATATATTNTNTTESDNEDSGSDVDGDTEKIKLGGGIFAKTSGSALASKNKKEIRPWDLGKKGVPSIFSTSVSNKNKSAEELDAKWLKDRRSDRETEFAPPSLYNDNRKFGKNRDGSSSGGSSKYSNFVRSSTESVPQKPIEIQDEMLNDSNRNQEQNRRGQGTEIAPPMSFEYYNGSPGGARIPPPKNPTKDIEDSVLHGIKSIRKQLEIKKYLSKEEDQE